MDPGKHADLPQRQQLFADRARDPVMGAGTGRPGKTVYRNDPALRRRLTNAQPMERIPALGTVSKALSLAGLLHPPPRPDRKNGERLADRWPRAGILWAGHPGIYKEQPRRICSVTRETSLRLRLCD